MCPARSSRVRMSPPRSGRLVAVAPQSGGFWKYPGLEETWVISPPHRACQVPFCCLASQNSHIVSCDGCQITM